MSNYLRASHYVVLTTLLTLLSGCVFTPTTSRHQPYNKTCDMKTQQLTLSPVEQRQTLHCNHLSSSNNILSCIVFEGIILPAGSFIVSGSIVLINNTLHWMEYKGKCDSNEPEEKADTTSPDDITGNH